MTVANATVLWDPSVLAYKFSLLHPMDPIRLQLTFDLARLLGVLDGVQTSVAPPASRADLLRVHSEDYVAAVSAAGSTRIGPGILAAYGLGNDDNPVFAQMHDAASAIAGSTLAGARAIASGRARRAVNIAGGMHHAMKSHASGFCIYNDVGIGISYLLEQGFDRIAYVDIDAHHGDGVQAMYWDDPRVLTVSVHEDPRYLWPNTGYPSESGGREARGSAVNIPVPANCSDSLWLRSFDAVVPGVLRAFRPQIIVSQCGADSHRTDPLTDLELTVDGQRAAIYLMRDLADELCDGRWLAVGGGGYQLVSVVPRSWTHLLAAVLGRDLAPATPIPAAWQSLVALLPAGRAEIPSALPSTMGDGGDLAFRRWDPVVHDVGDTSPTAIADRFIARSRSAVYPLFGLDPEDPRD